MGFLKDLFGVTDADLLNIGKPSGPIYTVNLIKEIKKYDPPSSAVHKPVPGTPVYCNLAIAFEHTGIYIGNNEIAHLNGDGDIEAVSPGEFVGRLDGSNPAITIYFAEYGGKALGSSTIANRAKSLIGSRRDYRVLLDNCHQFTCGCISGDFENPCNYFWMVKMEIQSKFGSFCWKVWDY